MLKGIGIVLILLGTSGLGMTMAGELDKRIEELQTLQKLMMILKGEIRYMHQPLPEAFLRLGRSSPEPFGGFFVQTAQSLQARNGQTARQIWTDNLKIYLSELHISRQEQKELSELGSMLGYLDVEMQLNALDYYLEQLGRSVERAVESQRGRRRLYRYLGVLSGIMLVIFII